jgi:hypothetical protein
MPLATPLKHTTQLCVGSIDDLHNVQKQSHLVSVSTVRSEDVSIDNSQMIDVSTHTRKSVTGFPIPRNRVLLPSNALKPLLPVLNEQGTDSTHTSDSLFDEVEDSKAPPTHHCSTARYTTQQAHDDSTRHVANLGHAQQQQQLSMEPTRHASNMAPLHTSKSSISANLDNVPEQGATSPFGADYARLDEDTDQAAAWAIHIALILFCSLVCISLVLSFVVIDSYGFLTLFFMSVVVGFCLGLAWFVDKTVLQKNEKLKPIRNKIVVAMGTAKHAISEELDLFKNDWSEFHLLLTNAEYTDQEEEGNGTSQTTPKLKRKKSVLFKMVKPFLGGGRKLFKRKKSRSEKNDTKSMAQT